MSYEESPSLAAGTVVEIHDKQTGKDFCLPIRGKNDDRPGIYSYGAVYYTRFPRPDMEDYYDSKNLSITDYSNIESINEYFRNNSQVREIENSSLTDSDEIFYPNYSGKETNHMKAFKDAVSAKGMDINLYAPRFGDNFLNERRLLNGDDITIKKIISIANNIDIEAELI